MALVGCLALSACEYLEDDAIFKRFSAQGAESVSIDAHQRAIVTTQVRDESGNVERTIYCAEPSPDAFASISRTITGSLGRSGEQDGFSAELAKSLASQASDALSARNATIQLLRDGLYRACEGYASGALSKTEYSEITRQYQHIMAALLSIELLSNINRPIRASYTSPQQDGETDNEEPGKEGSGVAGETQDVLTFRALEHDSISRIASVAERLVEQAMKIGDPRQSPREVEECFRAMRMERIPEEYINICSRLISGQLSSIRDSEPDLQALASDLGLSDTPIADLTVGQTVSLEFESSDISKTYSFDISERGEYEISVTAVAPHHGDPALILTSTGDAVLGAADDSEGGLDAKTKMTLGEGEYELQVFNLDTGKGSFELLIDRVDE